MNDEDLGSTVQLDLASNKEGLAICLGGCRRGGKRG